MGGGCSSHAGSSIETVQTQQPLIQDTGDVSGETVVNNEETEFITEASAMNIAVQSGK
jgi:hypothetical protein